MASLIAQLAQLSAMRSPASRAMVSIASVPSREPSLRNVVGSLLHQAGRINVYLNGYAETPEYLDHPKLVVARSQEYGDVGDAGKFFWLGSDADYYLTCDDDILYPPDYVARTIAAIERYGRRAVIGWHGALLDEPFSDYYATRTILSFYRECKFDTPVHVLGTGATGFHVSTLEIAFPDFHAPNMADIWLAAKGQRAGVPFIVCAHQANELRPLEQPADDEAIWKACVTGAGSVRDTRARQNEVVLAHWPWRVHSTPAVSVMSRWKTRLGFPSKMQQIQRQ